MAKQPKLPPRPWPRLTETLEGEKNPLVCQACGRGSNVTTTNVWQEHDENDQPEYRLVVLCVACSEDLIERHPRLYRRLETFDPMLGVMGLCDQCVHRDGVRCQCPTAKINGGLGLTIIFPDPDRAFVCRGRGRGGPVLIYKGPATACDGREERGAADKQTGTI